MMTQQKNANTKLQNKNKDYEKKTGKKNLCISSRAVGSVFVAVVVVVGYNMLAAKGTRSRACVCVCVLVSVVFRGTGYRDEAGSRKLILDFLFHFTPLHLLSIVNVLPFFMFFFMLLLLLLAVVVVVSVRCESCMLYSHYYCNNSRICCCCCCCC